MYDCSEADRRKERQTSWFITIHSFTFFDWNELANKCIIYFFRFLLLCYSNSFSPFNVLFVRRFFSDGWILYYVIIVCYEWPDFRLLTWKKKRIINTLRNFMSFDHWNELTYTYMFIVMWPLIQSVVSPVIWPGSLSQCNILLYSLLCCQVCRKAQHLILK